jgi:hypothetical protein
MRIHTCAVKDKGAPMHPCANAVKAVREAGYDPEIATVGGFKALGFTRRGKRDHIRELTGQEDVPVLEVGDGTVVTGNKAIIAWAKANPSPGR